MAETVAVILVLGIAAYAVLGGADFGGGFWDLAAGGTQRGEERRNLIERSITPVWEANHIWLIFALVICWTCFPIAFGSIGLTLYLPLFFAAVGIIFRGASFAFREEMTTIPRRRFFGAIFATSSVITPFFLGAVIGAIASGQVPEGGDSSIPISSWTNATSIFAGFVAIAFGAFLAAVYLAGDAARTDQAALASEFRTRALGAGIIAGALALAGLLVAREDTPPLYEGLTDEALVLVVVSGVGGICALALLWARRFRPARAAAAFAVAAVLFGWAVAQSPYFLVDDLTVQEAAASDATLLAVIVVVAIGALVLIPALGYLFYLVTRGTFDDAPTDVE